MKWFKHLSDASQDEFLRAIKAEYGFAGLGRWWAIVEAVAGQMKVGSDKCEVEMSWSEWATLLKMRPKQLLKFFYFLVSNRHSNVDIKCFGEAVSSLRVDFEMVSSSFQSGFEFNFSIPKLLELRDSKNRVRTQRGPIEVEVEGDKEKGKEKATPKAKKGTPVKMPKAVIKAWDNLQVRKLPEPKWEKYALVKGVQVELFPIFESFCIHHKKKGSVWVSWYAAWQKWIQNAERFNPEFFKSPEKKSSLDLANAKIHTLVTWAVGSKHTRDELITTYDKYWTTAHHDPVSIALPELIKAYEEIQGELNG